MLHDSRLIGYHGVFCIRAAGGLGKGIYFFKNWADAADKLFSPPDEQNYKRIVQCRVLTGNSTIPSRDYDPDDIFMAPLMPNSSTKRYDSVVDEHKEKFVIFRDGFAYPEYLVTFI